MGLPPVLPPYLPPVLQTAGCTLVDIYQLLLINAQVAVEAFLGGVAGDQYYLPLGHALVYLSVAKILRPAITTSATLTVYVTGTMPRSCQKGALPAGTQVRCLGEVRLLLLGKQRFAQARATYLLAVTIPTALCE
jgi:hypothetical protein